MRTCIGCRKQAPRSRLFRLGATGAALHVDAGRSEPGRGVWVHPSRRCVGIALKRGTILGKKVPSNLVELVRLAITDEILAEIVALRRAGGLVLGRFRLAERDCAVVLTAGPAPPWLGSVRAIALPVDRDALGRAAGGIPRRAVGVLAGRMSGGLARDLDDLREIG